MSLELKEPKASTSRFPLLEPKASKSGLTSLTDPSQDRAKSLLTSALLEDVDLSNSQAFGVDVDDDEADGDTILNEPSPFFQAQSKRESVEARELQNLSDLFPEAELSEAESIDLAFQGEAPATAQPRDSLPLASEELFKDSDQWQLQLASKDRINIGEYLDGRYRITRVLGEGGFGVVYAAEDERENGQCVAIKTLRRNMADYELAAKRFEREIILSQSIHSPHAVKIFNSGISNGIHYFVMEYLEGDTLALHIYKNKRISLYDSKLILLQILDALKEAHSKNIIHRDLKPSNIILNKLDENSNTPFNVKVLDFGIAKVLDTALGEQGEKLTRTGSWMGSPSYMSPEHLAGRPLSPASDIYAIGLIAIEMLTGQTAVDGETPMEIAVRQLSQEEIPIVDWLEETSFGPILKKAVDKQATQRYASALELSQALSELSDDTLKNEFIGLKLRRFTAEHKRISSPMDGFKQSAALYQSAPAISLLLSPQDQRRQLYKFLLGGAIILALIVLLVIGFLKFYIDRVIDYKAPQVNLIVQDSLSPDDAKPDEQANAPLNKIAREQVFHAAAMGCLGAFELPRANVSIMTVPSGADIIDVDTGKLLGQAPLELNYTRAYASLNLLARLEGYQDYQISFSLERRTRDLVFTLLPPNPAAPEK